MKNNVEVKTIVIIDDDNDVGPSLQKYLMRRLGKGFEVLYFPDPGIMLGENLGKVDVLISDWFIWCQDVEEFVTIDYALTALYRVGKKPKKSFVYSGDERRHHAIHSEITAWLVKPTDPERWIKMILE